MTSSRRVVVTGLGAISAAGQGVDTFWRACVEGEAKLRPIERFDVSDLGSPQGGEVPLAQPGEDAVARFVEIATREALHQAGLEKQIDPAATGVVLGTCLGETDGIFRGLRERGATPPALPAGYSGLAQRLAGTLGLRGPVTTVSSACISGTAAVALAADSIRRGEADAMLAGGAEQLSRFIVSGFWLLRALAAGPVRPFDRRRDGLCLGEGAGVLVLEERERARRRGGAILAEVLGSGSASDAHHMTGPSPTGDGLVRAIEATLRQAQCPPQDVDFVNAHGTGTQYNDRMETIAIKQVLGAHAYEIPVVSVKPVVGHTLGAAGALEAILSVKVLQERIVPSTVGYAEPDPECDLDYVPHRARERAVRRALSCSSAFGGANGVLLLGAP